MKPDMILFGNGISGQEDIEASDARIVIESILIDSLSVDEADELTANTEAVQALVRDEIVTERTIVKMDKKARLARATKAACFAIARRKKDIKFKKLITIWRIERQLEAYLYKKYRNEAIRMAKIAVNRKPANGTSGGPAPHPAAVKKAISTAKTQLNAATA